jgi:hypothetical protein
VRPGGVGPVRRLRCSGRRITALGACNGPAQHPGACSAGPRALRQSSSSIQKKSKTSARTGAWFPFDLNRTPGREPTLRSAAQFGAPYQQGRPTWMGEGTVEAAPAEGDEGLDMVASRIAKTTSGMCSAVAPTRDTRRMECVRCSWPRTGIPMRFGLDRRPDGRLPAPR